VGLVILYWSIIIICSIPIYIGIGWVIFDDWDGFFEAIKFWLIPDIVSMVRGGWGHGAWEEMTFVYWLALCIGTTYGTHWVAQTYIL